MNNLLLSRVPNSSDLLRCTDENLRAAIEQKIDEAFKGLNVAVAATIVTQVCTEIAVAAAKHAMEKTAVLMPGK